MYMAPNFCFYDPNDETILWFFAEGMVLGFFGFLLFNNTVSKETVQLFQNLLLKIKEQGEYKYILG